MFKRSWLILFIKTRKRTQFVEHLLMPLLTLSLYLLHALYFRCSQNKDKQTNNTRGILPCLLHKIFMESPIPLHQSKNVLARSFSTFYEIYQVCPLRRRKCLHYWHSNCIYSFQFSYRALFLNQLQSGTWK